MAYSRQRAVSDGTLQRLDVAIYYIRRADISVLLDGVRTDQWSWAGNSDAVQFPSPIPSGVEVTIVRATQADRVIHEFAKGAKFVNTSMDEDFRQMLYLAQEYTEGGGPKDFFADVDMHGFKLRNVGDPVLPGDAVNLQSMNREYQSITDTANLAVAIANGVDAKATDAQIKAANAQTVANKASDWTSRRRVNIRDFGAIPIEENVNFDSGDAILAALAFCRANNNAGLDIGTGTYITTKSIILYQRDSMWGYGQNVSTIQLSGNAKFQTFRGYAIDSIDLRDFKLTKGGTVDTGLDIGTSRRGVYSNIGVSGFKIGVNLDIGEVLVANYWNRLTNIEVSCPSRETVGSVAFQLGNNVNVQFPDTDYNTLVGCKSFTCETAIKMTNAIGCQITGHQCTVVGNALIIESGNNNVVELVAENCTNMGYATAKARGNRLNLYNDGDLAKAFADAGWNYHIGQIHGVPTMANDSRELDCRIIDRVMTSFSTPLKKICSVLTNANHAAYTVTITYSGHTIGETAFAGVQVFDVRRTGVSTPTATLVRSTGPSAKVTAIASFNGNMEFNLSGSSSGNLTVCNVCVEVMGSQSLEVYPWVKPVAYTRLPA